MSASDFRSRRPTALVAGVATGLAVVAALGWVLATREDGHSREEGTAAPPSVSEQQGLDIRNVSVVSVDADDSLVRIQYDLVWQSAQYPGMRRCTWELMGSDGSVVGSDSTEVVSARPTVTAATRDVGATGPVASARGFCSESRLDDDAPSSYAYKISNVNVGTALADGSGWRLEVDFTADWLGSGAPGTVTCQAHALDSRGDVVYTQGFNLSLSSSGPVDTTTIITSTVQTTAAAAPVGAAITGCAPFEG
jgi:hypothetical protein